MLEGNYDYWRIHENEPPHLDLHYVSLFFEGRFHPEIKIKIGRYFETGAFISTEQINPQNIDIWNYERVTNYLRHILMIVFNIYDIVLKVIINIDV